MAGIAPGLDGYIAAQQLGQQRQAQELGMLSKILQMRQMQDEAARSQEYRGALTSLGPNATPQQLRGVLLQHGSPGTLVSLLQSEMKKPEGQSIGSGGLRLPDGTIIPPAERPNTKPTEQWSAPYQMGGAWVQRNDANGQIRQSVGREPQVNIQNPQPVTPVTIQDPDNPNQTIVIDGRTRAVLGRGPKMTEAGKIDATAMKAMSGLGADLQKAEDLLMGVARTSDGQVVKGNLPTGSGFGSAVDAVSGFFGGSPSGAAEADSLKTVAARLVGRVPRFEGPQSDKDVTLYKEAAGNVGNEKLPRERRLAAARTMREIYSGYETGERGRILGGSPSPVSDKNTPSSFVVNGYRFPSQQAMDAYKKAAGIP
jgi:hypothetical protein